MESSSYPDICGHVEVGNYQVRKRSPQVQEGSKTVLRGGDVVSSRNQQQREAY